MVLRFVLVVAVFLVGCERDSKFRKMPDYDLSQRYGECLDRKPTAPGQAQVCENLRKECERRKAELGSFICRVN
ncbi:MAG: hypothetical protein GYB33_06170 [Gammaproteobacteria bacterium]|uniref:hypothetical protein n=1 Tax=Pseudomaricurvus alcaniphilus TaxID=1166482 RepID=UPI00140DF347|nr:hypothetical protein [Pseudomaricurvus alcaniphilus]MBR9909925.1 hypothetical protein [Gammaproteobacteria bacterium]NHN38857.1 hypothetical protein [Pseudomaricurvus alcaniphilus]